MRGRSSDHARSANSGSCVLAVGNPRPPTAAYITASGGMLCDMPTHDFDRIRFQSDDILDIRAMISFT